MPLAASPTHTVRRWTRSLVSLTLALGLAGAAGACGDDDPVAPTSLNGTYSIQTYDGASATSQRVAGELILGGSEWTLFLEDLDDPEVTYDDQGTFSRSRERLTFTSDFFGNDFPGTVSNLTITVDYDFADAGDPPDIVRMMFRR
jgi:hypothetical protein